MIAIAREMGRHDWENLMDELTPHQFSVLLEHRHLYPIGERRQDMRHAHLVATIANLVRGEKDEPVKMQDALAHFLSEVHRKKEKKASPEQMARMASGRS